MKNFQRVHRLSRWISHRLTIAGKYVVVAMVVSGILGFDTTRNLSYQIHALLLAICCIALVSARFNRPRCEFRRSVTGLATVGEVLRYQIVVTNCSNRILTDLYLVDEIQSPYPDSSRAMREYRDDHHQENWFDRKVGFPRWRRFMRMAAGADSAVVESFDLAPYQTKYLDLEIRPLRRGTLRFSKINLGCPDPFGLYRSTITAVMPESMVILPRRYAVPEYALGNRRHHNPGGVVFASAVGESGEFHSLRDYRPDDPLRHIHWRSWARLGVPVVKTYEDEYFVRHALILDTFAETTNNILFECAVSVAASLVCRLEDQDSLLDLVFYSNEIHRFTAGRHVANSQAMLELLALVQPHTKEEFSILSDSVKHGGGSLAGAICVFLGWDKARSDLVRWLEIRGVKVVVLVISVDSSTGGESGLPGTPSATELMPARLIRISANDPVSSLSRISKVVGNAR